MRPLRVTLAFLVAVAATACAHGLSRFTSEVQNRYQLTPDDLKRIQFYVGVPQGDVNPRTEKPELVLNYRASQIARQTDEAKLSQRTVVTEKDFVIRDGLPGVYVADGKGADSLTVEVGTDARLTFAPSATYHAYTLAAINGQPYVVGQNVTIRGTDYMIQHRPTVLLLFNEKNSRQIFKERISAEGRRVR
jgi:hypothetical protein